MDESSDLQQTLLKFLEEQRQRENDRAAQMSALEARFAALESRLIGTITRPEGETVDMPKRVEGSTKRAERDKGPLVELEIPKGNHVKEASDHFRSFSDREDRATWEHPSGGNPRHMRMEFPTYDGSEPPLVWLSRAEYYFGHQCTPIEERVRVASFHLVGNAQIWFLRIRDSRQQLTWEEFKRLCHGRFGPHIGASTLGPLIRLQQTGTVEQFEEKFEQLLAQSGRMRPDQEVDIFVSGLKEFIRLDVELHRPSDLSEAMSLARLFERRMEAMGTTRMQQEGDGPPPSRTPQFVKGLTRAEMAERRAKGLCFNCDEHFTPQHQCKKLFLLELDDFEEGADAPRRTEHE